MSNPTSMLERIAKLLNQAENAGTEAEAATFMAKAQQMATTHSIDLAKARHATIAKERTTPIQRDIFIGDAKTRGLRTLTDLYLGIAHANDVKCTIAHNATRVYAYGFAEDIDVSEALFASLLTQQAKALDEFKRNGQWRDEKVWSDRTWEYKPQSWLTARLNFQDSYASRVSHRLLVAKMDETQRLKEAEELRTLNPHLDDDGALNGNFIAWFADRHGLDLLDEDATAFELTGWLTGIRRKRGLAGSVLSIMPDDCDVWVLDLLDDYVAELEAEPVSSGMDLVLADKAKAVDEFYAPARRAARGSYRGGTSGASSASGRAAGRAAGDRARLGASTAIGGTKGAISA